jgi:hypothetical protein
MTKFYNTYLHRYQTLSEMTFNDFINFDYRIQNEMLEAYATDNNIVISDANVDQVRKQLINSFAVNVD